MIDIRWLSLFECIQQTIEKKITTTTVQRHRKNCMYFFIYVIYRQSYRTNVCMCMRL